MKYGCIGERLGHSFSKEIHNALAPYEYELCEVSRDRIDEFIKQRDFSAINVTIPYKETVIEHLDEISDKARAIGAVNTVVNRSGRLFGYNTDHYGMTELIKKLGLDLKNKKVAILGTGGTSKTAFAVALDLGAENIIRVSRSGKDGAFTYEEFYEKHSDAEIIINTTPLGMYPNTDGMPIDLDKLQKVEGVIDAVYNPLRTRLISNAIEKGIKAEGGLYMLVAQAVRASEIFLDTSYPEGTTDKIYKNILSSKENIVLIGMPGSGKTTVGKILKKMLDRPLIDTDELIIEETGKQISDIFSEIGEEGFREIEEKIIKEKVLPLGGAIIATGGGAILKDSNVMALKQNGKLFFLDRPLESLIPTCDRPLASSADAIRMRYNERYGRYCDVCDIRIDSIGTAENTANDIIREFKK